jgi:hypothetical protein
MNQVNLEKYHRLIFCIYDNVRDQLYKKWRTNELATKPADFIRYSVWDQVKFETKAKVLNHLKKDLSNGKY